MKVPKKEWTDDDVQAEIKAAVAMVHEDQERTAYASLHEKYGKKEGDPDDKTPPPKPGDPEPPKTKKKSLYWGEVEE